jgi:lysine-specific demethylase 3
VSGAALRHFQHHWGLGEPVIVRNTHKTDHALSWEPFVMWRACRETSRKNVVEEASLVDALLCLDWTFVSGTLARETGSSWCSYMH